jgi:catechol 2,3-dioxygenase-like lactoylglutathione lyase family enzyme
MQLGKVTPILRIFDEAKALEFYVDFLGFKVDWQHRFEANFPLYLK